MVSNEAPNNLATVLTATTSSGGDAFSAESKLGTAIRAMAHATAVPAILASNDKGSALVGNSVGGVGASGVLGHNDGEGYGVRGYNTSTGIGVLGQTGYQGDGTGLAARFENLNGANANPAVIMSTAGAGPALLLERGPLASTPTNYASGGAVVSSILRLQAAGNFTLGLAQDGTHVWVINTSTGIATITNTVTGSFAIASKRAQQFLLFSNEWYPVQ